MTSHSQGVSLGAVTAALIATRGDEVSGLILISGLYDLPEFFATPKTNAAASVRAAAIAPIGSSQDVLLARSVLPIAHLIRATTLILNGAMDDRTNPAQARRLGHAIDAAGGRATVHIYPQFGHEIPVRAWQPEIDAFIERILKP